MDSSFHTQSPLFSFEDLGWNEYWESRFSPYKGHYLPGRVIAAHKTRYEVAVPGTCLTLPISGVMKTKRLLPVTGDFVVVLSEPEQAALMIVTILPRRSSLKRGGAGDKAGEQVLAANLDTVFIITEPGSDLSIPRLERYLLIVHESGARPVIILNKSDLASDPDLIAGEIVSILGDVPVHAISALSRNGLDQLSPYTGKGQTVLMIGSSGVGKSTLMNALFGSDYQKIGPVRENDGRGRHTTTVRELFLLPSGCSLIDTPGLREIRIWTAGEGIDKVFDDIVKTALNCRFSDCTHQHEPGCAVQAAIGSGELSPERFARYQKILKEIEFEHDKASIGLKRFEKKKFQGISMLAKEYNERRRLNNGR
jgi:ribosome biogenesis GTPase